MTEDRFSSAIRQLRDRWDAQAAARSPTATGACFALKRARALALNPALWSDEERAHAAGCRRCALIVKQFEREMPHLPVWLLVRRHFQRLTEAERELVEYHLVEGKCQCCHKRNELLVPVRSTIGLIARHVVLNRLHSASASFTPESAGGSLDGTLEIELVPGPQYVTLEIRTRVPAVKWPALLYALRSSHGQVTGAALLRPELGEWHTAEVRLDPELIRTELGGECEEAWVVPVDLEVLLPQEWELLELAAEADPRRWLPWVEGLDPEDYSPETSIPLRTLGGRLRDRREEVPPIEP